MLTILRRKLLNPNTLTLNSSTTRFRVLQIKCPINTYCSSQSSDSSDSQPNSTLSYEKRQKSAPVISFFKNHGFTETQIWNLGGLCPQILSSKPQKTLAPKIEFLLSIGISKDRLPKFLLSNPDILRRSLENHLIPGYNFLKSVVVDDSDVISMLNRYPRILNHDFKKDIVLNISTLMGIGLSEPGARSCLIDHPDVVGQRHTKFKRMIMEIIRIGLNPTNCVFVFAMGLYDSFCTRKTVTFVDLPDDVRLTDDYRREAFQEFLYHSSREDKVKKGMDFFLNEMGYRVEDICDCGYKMNLLYTLENRCWVIKALISRVND